MRPAQPRNPPRTASPICSNLLQLHSPTFGRVVLTRSRQTSSPPPSRNSPRKLPALYRQPDASKPTTAHGDESSAAIRDRGIPPPAIESSRGNRSPWPIARQTISSTLPYPSQTI